MTSETKTFIEPTDIIGVDHTHLVFGMENLNIVSDTTQSVEILHIELSKNTQLSEVPVLPAVTGAVVFGHRGFRL